VRLRTPIEIWANIVFTLHGIAAWSSGCSRCGRAAKLASRPTLVNPPLWCGPLFRLLSWRGSTLRRDLEDARPCLAMTHGVLVVWPLVAIACHPRDIGRTPGATSELGSRQIFRVDAGRGCRAHTRRCWRTNVGHGATHARKSRWLRALPGPHPHRHPARRSRPAAWSHNRLPGRELWPWLLDDDARGDARGAKRCDLDLFTDATFASAFVARWCVSSKVETPGGVFCVREDDPAPRVEAGFHRTPWGEPYRSISPYLLAARADMMEASRLIYAAKSRCWNREESS